MHGDSLYWKYGGILLWTDFWFNMLLKFKASMPLLANLTFRKGRFFVSEGSPTLPALKSLLEEISKMIPWSRCSADATPAKCKVNVDSYNSCSIFNGREYSLVRIWWRTSPTFEPQRPTLKPLSLTPNPNRKTLILNLNKSLEDNRFNRNPHAKT